MALDEDRAPNYGSDVISLLKEKAPRAAMALAALQAAYPGVRYVRNTIRHSRTYTVRVPGGVGSDGLYDELHEWVLNQLPEKKRKGLIAYAKPAVSYQGYNPFEDLDPAPSRLRLRHDGGRAQVITISGHKIKVAASEGAPPEGGKKATVFPEIVFTTSSLLSESSAKDARDALLVAIEEVLRASGNKTRAPVFRVLNTYDEWEVLHDLPPRSLESVILPPGQLQRITSDISRFLSSERDYNRRSIPWHRAHLYQGPPRTGKTSMARALAAHFRLNMWYLPLSDVKKDASLIKLISGVRSRSILLLEDIDIYHGATSRDDFGGSTLSGLLNSLDGIATPHGLITVMTANNPEKLDSALVQAGRADLTENFTLSGHKEAERLIARWYELPSSPPVRLDLEMSAADISEVCKGTDDIREAVRLLNEKK